MVVRLSQWNYIYLKQKNNYYFIKKPPRNLEVSFFCCIFVIEIRTTTKTITTMITINEIRETQSNLRTTISQSIVEFMENHNCTELDVTDFDSTPVILEDLDTGVFSYTMDSLTYDGDGNVSVHCSNCEYNDTLYISSLHTDILVDVYEWLLENEEFMHFN